MPPTSPAGSRHAPPALPDRAMLPVRRNKVVSWQDRVRALAAEDEAELARVNAYIASGFCVFRRAVTQSQVSALLDGEREVVDDSKRRRSANQVWRGARKTIHAHMEHGGGPLASRTQGRLDFPLPPAVAEETLAVLESSGVLRFAKMLCPRGSVRTNNIILSQPGSTRQPIHVDSAWEGRKTRSPAPHYLTILIPLTPTRPAMGGTRLWPGSHRSADFTPTHDDAASWVDATAPLIELGDVLVFDGLLAHCGMENASAAERYFCYVAFSAAHDPNVDVTGV